MNKPPQKRIKEFWEGYGFHKSTEGIIDWLKPDGSWLSMSPGSHLPPIDLNNLFEYAVPKALDILIKQGYVPPIMKLFQLWFDKLVSLTGDSSNVQYSALALFWALDKVRR